MSERILAVCPELHDLLTEIRSLEKERRTPASTYPMSAIRATRLLPSTWLYVVSVLLSTIFIGILFFIDTRPLADGHAAITVLNSNIPIQIAVVILALAIPVVSTYGGVGGRDELSIAYLWDTTGFGRFAQYAGAALVALLTCWVIGAIAGTGSRFALFSHVLMGILGLGLTVGTVLALIAIMLEVILVASHPSFAVSAGVKHHALALADGLYRHRYITLFMQTHGVLLDEATEKMSGIEGPGKLFKLCLDPNDRTQMSPWHIDKRIDFTTHYIDYDLEHLEKIADTLPEGTTVHLERSGLWMNKPGNRLELGQIVPKNPSLAQKLTRHSGVVRERGDRCFEWRDEHIEAWRDLLRRRISSILSEYNQTSFSALISTVRKSFFRCRSVLPKTGMESPSIWRLGEFYVEVLDQILRSEPGIGVTRARQVYDFVDLLQRQFRTGVNECVQHAELNLLNTQMGQIPRLYDQLYRWCELHEDELDVSSVHHIRAFWGRDFRPFDTMVSELPQNITPEHKRDFLYMVHRHCTEWLKRAIQRKDGDCARSIAKVLGEVFSIAARWHDELANVTEKRASFYDEILVRHLALIGEAIENVQESEAIGLEVAEEMLKVDVPIDTDNGLDVLAITDIRTTERMLDDFGHHWDFENARTDPLMGFSIGSGFGGLPERDKLFVGLTVCLLKALFRPPHVEPPPVRPQAVDVRQIESSLSTLKSAKGAIATHTFWTNQDEKRLLKWLRDCQQAYDVAKAIELSKAKLNKQLVAEYTEQFPKEYAGGLRLLRYLHETGFFSVSDSVEQGVIDYVAKNKFRTPEEKGYSVSNSANGLPQAFAHRSDGRLAFLLFDALDQRTKDSAVNEESTGELALAKDAPEAIRNAAQWLHQKHVDPTSGVIFWNRGNGNMAGYVLDGDKAWVPNWKDPAKIDGFAGRYAGYPVWECSVHHRPMIAAVDLRASKPLLVRPSVSENDAWCEVLEISVKLGKPLKQQIRESHRRNRYLAMVGHYCRRRLRFFWDVDVESLKEHANLFCFETDKKEEASDR